ncbi:cadherin repeat domain-containing protein [Photobacterium kagoshimensis]|uniref:cadherin repeat domain-containing protein n=1 Tax=Photobacterium kagoshimensis TaxID=2910242 RepID=UPI003D129630
MKYKTLAILISTSLLLTGCGGGGDGESSSPSVAPDPLKPTNPLPAPDTKPSKQPRMQLGVTDVEVTYGHGKEVILAIKNQMGNLTYEQVSTNYTNVAKLDPLSNTLTILNAGEITYKVTDTSDDFQTSSSTFTVKVKKAQAPTPLLKEVVLDQKDRSRYFTVDNARGNLSVELDSGSSTLVDLQYVGGYRFAITPKNPGVATGFIVDAGNQNYAGYKIPFKIDIKKAITNNFSDIEMKFGAKPLHQTLSSEATYTFQANDPEIISIDQASGTIQALKVGRTYVDVTYKSIHSNQAAIHDGFYVDIVKGDRPAAFNAAIAQDLPYSTLIQQPKLHLANQTGKLSYELVSGNNIRNFSNTNGSFLTTGLGTVEIKVTDKSDNYVDASDLVTFEVVKADHPPLATLETNYTYSSSEHTVTIPGQKGTLQLKPSDTSILRVDGNKLTTLKAGITTVGVTDISELYNTATTTLTVHVERANRNAFTVKPVNQKYSASSIKFTELYDYSENSATVQTPPVVSVKANSDGAVSLNQTNKTLNINKAGSATLELYWPQDDQYKESDKKTVEINITPADNRLTLAARSVSATYQIDTKTIGAPKVEGKKGTISYRIKSGSPTDVVSIDSTSGLMTVNNAGNTTIEVIDSGNESFMESKTTFTAIVHQAKADLVVEYPNEIALGGDKFLQPKISRKLWDLNFTVDNTSIAEVANNSNGHIELKSPGTVLISYNGTSRNYQAVRGQSYLKVLKEAHPGIKVENLDVYYTPLEQKKSVKVTSQQYGARTFIPSGSPGSRYSYNFNTRLGTISDIQDYPFSISFAVTESESEKYQAAISGSKQADQGVIHIYPPQPNDSDKDYTLTLSSSSPSLVIESGLNSPRYSGLLRSSLYLKGYDKHYLPTQTDVATYGNGFFASLRVKPVGNDDIKARTAVRVVINRYDGCESAYNDSSSLMPNMAINFNTDGQNDCKTEGERANYFTKFTLLDSHHLTPGEWELVDPLVIYRAGKREFIDTPTGGSYVQYYKLDEDKKGYLESIHADAQSKMRKVYEWNTVNLRFSI